MSTSQKRLLIILVFACPIIFVGWFWAKFIRESHLESRSKAFQVEFDELSSQSKNTLDLRSFRPSLWDEAIVWGAYVDICSLGINGYPSGDSSCWSLSEDAACRLLLLKENHLVAIIAVERLKMNICYSKLPERIKKDRFFLKTIEEAEFPKVAIVPM